MLKNAIHCFSMGADWQEMLIEVVTKRPALWDIPRRFQGRTNVEL